MSVIATANSLTSPSHANDYTHVYLYQLVDASCTTIAIKFFVQKHYHICMVAEGVVSDPLYPTYHSPYSQAMATNPIPGQTAKRSHETAEISDSPASKTRLMFFDVKVGNDMKALHDGIENMVTQLTTSGIK